MKIPKEPIWFFPANIQTACIRKNIYDPCTPLRTSEVEVEDELIKTLSFYIF